MEQDEIYLIDLWRIFTCEWRWFSGVLIAVLACTYAFTHSVKPQWEATAWIQIGQVGPVPPGLDPKVEPLLRVIERLQLVPFENEILESIGFASDSPEAQLYRNSLKLEPMPYAGPLVRLNVRARSPQQARQFATATVTRLQAVHRQLEVLPLKYAHEHLAQVEMDLRDALADRARLLQVAASGPGATRRARALRACCWRTRTRTSAICSRQEAISWIAWGPFIHSKHRCRGPSMFPNGRHSRIPR